MTNGIRVAIDVDGNVGPVDDTGLMLFQFGRVAQTGDQREWGSQTMNEYGRLGGPHAHRTRREAIEYIAQAHGWYTPIAA